MTKLKEFKENNSEFSFSLFDFLTKLDGTPTNKFLPMMVNIFKNSIQNRILYRNKEEYLEILDRYKSLWSKLGLINEEDILSRYDLELLMIKTSIIQQWFSPEDLTSIKEFINFYEKKYYKNIDVNQIKTIEEVNSLVSVASIKHMDKELAKQVNLVYEDDTWLLIRPLTWEASKKYGAATKWCTASYESYNSYFSYSERGVLLYIINKNTGRKTAMFKEFYDINNPNKFELSFWNEEDHRIDSMFAGFDGYIFDIFKSIENKTNKQISNGLFDEEYNKYHINEAKIISINDTPIRDEETELHSFGDFLDSPLGEPDFQEPIIPKFNFRNHID
jgi:hypothetical protein